jgi:uncharacterized membrane protein (TIGR02234 family)
VPATRLRLLAFLGIAVFAAGLFLAWSQPWFELELERGPLVVGGDVAGGALAPLALASLALLAALALAGPFFRVVLGVLEALLGVVAVISTAAALGDPAGISGSAITDLTGVSGPESIAALVLSSSATVWPFVAIVIGVLMALLGLAIVVTARRWPGSSRRYSRTAAADATIAGATTEAPSAEPDPVAEWDALSGGDDPTSR